MKIRTFQPSDELQIRKLYDMYYNDNEFPGFSNGFYCSFVITDDDGKIITAAGIKPIIEAVAVTDKSFPTGIRLDALLQVLGSTISATKSIGFEQIHAFVHDDGTYIRYLQKFGFKLSDNKVLIMDLKDG